MSTRINTYMKPFSSYYNDYSKTKMHQITRNSLDPAIFEFPDDNLPILHPIIKTQIMQDVSSINKIIPVMDFYMVGNMLTNNYQPYSPIEVYVKINKELVDEMIIETINNYLKVMNGKMAAGSQHPIFYYITQEDETKDKFNVSYDVENERWNQERDSLSESIIDYAHDTLDPQLWDLKDDPPSFKEVIKKKIIGSLKDYFSENFFNNYIDEIHVTGSIGTQQWKHNTDIDIHIIPKHIEKYRTQYESLRTKVQNHFNENKILIGEHPLEVYIQLEPTQESRGDSSYDLTNDKWIKYPFTLSSEFDPDVEFSYLKKDLTKIFKNMDLSLGELRRDLIDYNLIEEYLKNLKPEEKNWLKDKLYSKLKEIEDDIKDLVDQKNDYHQARKEMYSNDDIEAAWRDVIKSKSWTPGNIIWKMLDKYKYVSLIVSLQKLIKDNELKPGDVEDVEDVVNLENYLSEKKFTPLFKRKKKGEHWIDPLKSYKQLPARGITRKRLSYVPHVWAAAQTLPNAQGVLDNAKDAESGIWRITPRQALEIAAKYHLKIPTIYTYRNWRKLGKTGIALWLHKPTRRYFLLKREGITKERA